MEEPKISEVTKIKVLKRDYLNLTGPNSQPVNYPGLHDYLIMYEKSGKQWHYSEKALFRDLFLESSTFRAYVLEDEKMADWISKDPVIKEERSKSSPDEALIMKETVELALIYCFTWVDDMDFNMRSIIQWERRVRPEFSSGIFSSLF
jgi:hypothetical protein